jgi:hypothetical protein
MVSELMISLSFSNISRCVLGSQRSFDDTGRPLGPMTVRTGTVMAVTSWTDSERRSWTGKASEEEDEDEDGDDDEEDVDEEELTLRAELEEDDEEEELELDVEEELATEEARGR